MKTTKIKEPYPDFLHQTFGKPFSFKKSLLFISLHKCATRFFSNHVLHQLPGRQLINYQRMHYMENSDIKENKNIIIKTRRYGYVYGVIRLLDPSHPSFQLTQQLLDNKNLQRKKIIFYIRDPRDILVSMYYSFGFTHTLSPNPPIRQYQEERRQRIQQLTIDQYALETAPQLLEKFNRLIQLIHHHPPSDTLLLRYEDMVDRFDPFYTQLSGFITVKRTLREELFQQSRPPETEQLSQHKRKGTPGDFMEKLDQKTLPELDRILEPILNKFQYSPWETTR